MFAGITVLGCNSQISDTASAGARGDANTDGSAAESLSTDSDFELRDLAVSLANMIQGKLRPEVEEEFGVKQWSCVPCRRMRDSSSRGVSTDTAPGDGVEMEFLVVVNVVTGHWPSDDAVDDAASAARQAEDANRAWTFLYSYDGWRWRLEPAGPNKLGERPEPRLVRLMEKACVSSTVLMEEEWWQQRVRGADLEEIRREMRLEQEAHRRALEGLQSRVPSQELEARRRALKVIQSYISQQNHQFQEPVEQRRTFQLTSSAFGDNKPFPDKCTAKGEDISPPLQWTRPPAGTKQLAPDTNPKVHWVVYAIAPYVSGLPEGIPRLERVPEPPGALQGKNSWSDGNIGYRGPTTFLGSWNYRQHLATALLRQDTLPGQPGSVGVQCRPGAGAVVP